MLDTTTELMHGLTFATNQVLTERELNVADIPANLIGAPLREIYDVLVLPFLPSSTDDSMFGQWKEFFTQGVDGQPESALFDDVLVGLQQIIERSSFRLKLGVATTKPTQIAFNNLGASVIPSGAMELFSVIQGTDVEMSPKPCPDVILECAKKLGVDIGRTIYIGDTARDAQAAKSAGCAASLTIRRDGKSDDLGADRLIRSFLEIETVLEDVLREKAAEKEKEK